MRAVIDTNVILVANNAHRDVSEECHAACTARLVELARRGRVVIDDANEIVEEYLKKTEPWTGQRAGDVFLKWLLNNQGNPRRVQRVSVTPTGKGSYAELDALNLPQRLDPSDRKFVAVAAATNQVTPILEATDSEWLNWWQDLAAAGVHIEFMCQEDIGRFYRRKFPERAQPGFP